MIAPATPANEAERLQALHAAAVLDTPAEEDFDDVTRLAATICEAPIAMVSLVDGDRQFFKSCVAGGAGGGTPRDISFCGHAILESDLFVVEDALEDERFADNPLVLGEDQVRFYAGAPLITKDGHALGSLGGSGGHGRPPVSFAHPRTAGNPGDYIQVDPWPRRCRGGGCVRARARYQRRRCVGRCRQARQGEDRVSGGQPRRGRGDRERHGCPKGTRAAGGGFATSEPVIRQVNSSASLVFESRRIRGRQWRASALQVIGGPMTLTSYVYCQARLGRVRARSQPINLAGAGSTIGAATARCPRRSRAISGGFGTSTPVAPISGAIPFESTRQGRRAWRVTAILGTDIAATLTSYVYCSRRRSIGPVFPASDVAVGQGAVADVLAGPCPRWRSPIAGGFVTSTPSLLGQAEIMVVFESRRIKRHWRVRGFEGGEQSTSSNSLIGAAYC